MKSVVRLKYFKKPQIHHRAPKIVYMSVYLSPGIPWNGSFKGNAQNIKLR